VWDSKSDALGNAVHFPVHAGAGLRYYITDQISIRGDFRYYRGPANRDPYTLGAGYAEFGLGISWVPHFKPTAPAAEHIPGDADGDGIPDDKDGCPNEPEDKDMFLDDDGCPDPDNDGDGIPDAQDKCPNDPEDKDGFEDEDGCPDLDNDGDGFPDAVDKCPNDPETVNGFEDDDGCPDVRATTGPEERADRIDLKGQPITFGKDGKLTPQSRQVLTQVATIIKAKKLTIRVEVHLPLGTKATAAATITAQKKKDKAAAQKRAQAILEFLVSQGIAQAQLQAVGIGSDRPLGSANPTDPINDRVDLIKAQQRSP
jgi:outer membrane protein OmpA-like peptidoglycan-associated protein